MGKKTRNMKKGLLYRNSYGHREYMISIRMATRNPLVQNISDTLSVSVLLTVYHSKNAFSFIDKTS